MYSLRNIERKLTELLYSIMKVNKILCNFHVMHNGVRMKYSLITGFRKKRSYDIIHNGSFLKIMTKYLTSLVMMGIVISARVVTAALLLLW